MDHIIRNRFVYLSRVQWNWWSLMLNSGEEERKAHITLIGFGFFLCLYIIPGWLLPPQRRKVIAGWDAATVQRLGRDWYWDETRREFGCYLSGNHFAIKYGVQPDCSPGDKSWGIFLPFAQQRYMGLRWFDLEGKQCAALSERAERAFRADGNRWNYDLRAWLEECVPKVRFEVEDYDGKLTIATTHIEEREWRLGTGWFEWLSFFCSPGVQRTLSIEFDNEVGPEKGSWKGGLMGTSIRLLPGELHDAAFARWCAKGETGRGRGTGYPLKVIRAIDMPCGSKAETGERMASKEHP